MSVQLADRQIVSIPMNEILSDDDFNCRGPIAPIDVVDLARSIEQHGLQTPIMVQPYNRTVPNIKYRIVSGHRRYKACQINKMERIDAIVAHGLTEIAARQLNLEENLKRKDLNILQEARAIKHFYDDNWTEEMIASRLGMSRGWVQVRLILLRLPEEIQTQAAAGYLTQEQIKSVSKLKSKDEQFEAVRKIKQAKITGENKMPVIQKKRNPLAKKARDKNEIFALMEHIIDSIGGNFGTRLLAWACGEVSDFEIHNEIKEFARQNNKIYHIPIEILQGMPLAAAAAVDEEFSDDLD